MKPGKVTFYICAIQMERKRYMASCWFDYVWIQITLQYYRVCFLIKNKYILNSYSSPGMDYAKDLDALRSS